LRNLKIIKNIRLIAKNVLLNEADAIKNLVRYLDKDFENCVKAILVNKGRVIVTGVGKSAIIANKIVATLNSTGTPAIFMHAADAIHGDLGMIQKEDIVICLSKSGNTSEIKVLVPLLKRTGSKLIALVSNTNSFLAKESDYVLNATIDKEACPHDLAPTTSTTAALALGDALAICLLEMREFSRKDFAKFHPGGALGRKLYLKVSDIYPHHSVPVVRDDAKIKAIIMEISSKRLGAAAVINKKKELIGVITDGDLRRMLNKHDNISGIQASDIMTKSPKTIDADEYAVNALKIMQDKNITQLIVVKNNKLAGFVHIHDLLKEGLI
jgi:arabinose-5-phosphate isomerase